MNTGVLATIQAVVVACAVCKPVACSHWWKVTPRKPEQGQIGQVAACQDSGLLPQEHGRAQNDHPDGEAYPHDGRRGGLA